MSATNETKTSIRAVHERLDKAGMTASTACAIHCAAMPLLVSSLPLIGLGFFAHEGVEWALLGTSAVLAISSLCLGYRQHRQSTPLLVVSIGLFSMLSSRVAQQMELDRFEVVAAVAGGLIIATAHFVNLRLCRTCAVCHDHKEKRHSVDPKSQC